MKNTYETAITKVFKDEGGYTNEASDPGGPTNWGITIYDAREFWKQDATAEDVRDMPKSVAEDIYAKHYATPIRYDDLPAGVDYSVLDYAINSGISKSIKTLQEILNVQVDGVVGEDTIKASYAKNTENLINQIWDQRLAYDQSLTHLWPIYGKGWTARINSGRELALSLYNKYPSVITDTPTTPSAKTPSFLDSFFTAISTFFKSLFK